MKKNDGNKGDEMLNLENNTTELKKIIEEAINHPYLLEYIDKPEIDLVKLEFLMVLFNQTDMTDREKKQTVLAAMLVQMALDTHEKVTLSIPGEDTSDFLKSRQLTILAGDYFSGLYYSILAGLEKVDYISCLAAGIKDVNENKIKLYQAVHTNAAELIDSIKAIEAALVCKAADACAQPSYKQLFSDILLIKRLYDEKNYCSQGLKTIVLNQIEDYLAAHEPSTDILGFIDSQIASVFSGLQQSSVNHEIKTRFISKFDKLAKKL
ncbi:heptaprenyl diphosphate synthase component 1 [Peribacillus deserti]|uniref:Heptaprenyl diphosphate synthase n=1 Tax=Peribacillus deserti TaxID=673318 RepID=A0A2N5M1V1_9BACI|nr:heptaprenyl diphosphate synthase component 1 [Peribacillus deserti]PLT28329.1 heptaprenyl diphosphate synthase [Peribacillus deserti]